MYKVDIDNKTLIPIPKTAFAELNLRERFDIQEWVDKTPEILGEPLLVISKELILPSGKRLDLLAVDKQGALVVVELKRDDSGSEVEWQAIKYASYCSAFTREEVYGYYAEYLGADSDDAQEAIEAFIDAEPEELNEKQRIILVSKEFHSDVISAVMWLRDFGVDVSCVRLTPYLDGEAGLYITPEVIIPLPEAKTYIKKKETKAIEQRRTGVSSYSLENSSLPEEDLKARLRQSLSRASDLTPRLIEFFGIIVEEDRAYDREEVKQKLHEAGIGKDVSQAGRYLSNISQFLTNKRNPHLRQIVEFQSSGTIGASKNDYHVLTRYRGLVEEVLEELAVAGTEDKAGSPAE